MEISQIPHNIISDKYNTEPTITVTAQVLTVVASFQWDNDSSTE